MSGMHGSFIEAVRHPDRVPTSDGDVNYYLPTGAHGESKWFDKHHPAIFVNGVMNSPREHRESAQALSLVLMRPIIGVYNASDGLIRDLWQSAHDKYQFHGPAAASATEVVRSVGVAAPPEPALARTRATFAYNRCTLKLFNLLMESRLRSADVHAHSQGSIILCNALCGLDALGYHDAVRLRKYVCYGSPVLSGSWPLGIQRQEYDFSFDYVTMVTRLGPAWSGATLGLPAVGSPFSHSFLKYLQNMPDFIINTYRVGGLGVTFSMDEEGLAAHLLELPYPMVRSVFQRLRQIYWFDEDDVALAYVNRIRERRGQTAVGRIKRDDPELHRLLVDALESGWTADDERRCIEQLG